MNLPLQKYHYYKGYIYKWKKLERANGMFFFIWMYLLPGDGIIPLDDADQRF